MFESLNAFNFLFVALNLLILYLVLRKILFKPVTEFMENRTQNIINTIEDAENQKAQALKMKEEYEKQLNGARSECEKLLEQAHHSANAESEEIIEKARQEASFLLEKARAEIERERQQMLKEVHNQVVDLAIEAASKIIESNLDNDKNKKLIENFLSEEGAA